MVVLVMKLTVVRVVVGALSRVVMPLVMRWAVVVCLGVPLLLAVAVVRHEAVDVGPVGWGVSRQVWWAVRGCRLG